MVATCSIEGCGRPFHAKNYCLAHYLRLRRTGRPRPDYPIRPSVNLDPQPLSWPEYVRDAVEPIHCGPPRVTRRYEDDRGYYRRIAMMGVLCDGRPRGGTK